MSSLSGTVGKVLSSCWEFHSLTISQLIFLIVKFFPSTENVIIECRVQPIALFLFNWKLIPLWARFKSQSSSGPRCGGAQVKRREDSVACCPALRTPVSSQRSTQRCRRSTGNWEVLRCVHCMVFVFMSVLLLCKISFLFPSSLCFHTLFIEASN